MGDEEDNNAEGGQEQSEAVEKSQKKVVKKGILRSSAKSRSPTTRSYKQIVLTIPAPPQQYVPTQIPQPHFVTGPNNLPLSQAAAPVKRGLLSLVPSKVRFNPNLVPTQATIPEVKPYRPRSASRNNSLAPPSEYLSKRELGAEGIRLAP